MNLCVPIARGDENGLLFIINDKARTKWYFVYYEGK
jgi:hypothetical protein